MNLICEDGGFEQICGAQMLLLMAPTSKQWLLFKPRLHVSMQDSPLLHKPQIKHSKNKQSFCTNLNYFSQCWMQIVLLQQANNDCYSRHNSMWACNTALCSLNPRSDIRKTNRVFAQTEWFFTMWNANSAAHGTNKQAMIVIQATLQPFFTLLSLVVSKVIVRGVIILWPTLERQAAACFCLFLLPQLSWG